MSSRPPAVVDVESDRLFDVFRQSDCVLISVGGGFSYDSGLNFQDEELFRRLFPTLIPMGLRCLRDVVGYHKWSEETEWAFMAHYEAYIRDLPPQTLYADLLCVLEHHKSELAKVGKDWDWFVVTTNSDGLFRKHGFPRSRICELHGSFENLQCKTPCNHNVWLAAPVLERIEPHVDPQVKCEITDPELMPRCPSCGGTVWFNGAGGPWYFDDYFVEAKQEYEKFVQNAIQEDKKLVVLEFGVGFMTPFALREPNEQLAKDHTNVTLVRVNPSQWDVSDETIREKSIGLPTSSLPVVQKLRREFGPTQEE